MSDNTFSQDIEEICKKKKVPYIDAVVIWCEQNNLEVESAAYWIKKEPALKAKIQAEAEMLNVLKRGEKGAKLPL